MTDGGATDQVIYTASASHIPDARCTECRGCSLSYRAPLAISMRGSENGMLSRGTPQLHSGPK